MISVLGNQFLKQGHLGVSLLRISRRMGIFEINGQKASTTQTPNLSVASGVDVPTGRTRVDKLLVDRVVRCRPCACSRTNRTVSRPAFRVVAGPPPTIPPFTLPRPLSINTTTTTNTAIRRRRSPTPTSSSPSPIMASVGIATVLLALAVLALAAVSAQELAPSPAPASAAFAVSSPVALVFSLVTGSLVALLLKSN